ncbi:hypothetical protein D3C87_1529760 [compost metagenome]
MQSYFRTENCWARAWMKSGFPKISTVTKPLCKAESPKFVPSTRMSISTSGLLARAFCTVAVIIASSPAEPNRVMGSPATIKSRFSRSPTLIGLILCFSSCRSLKSCWTALSRLRRSLYCTSFRRSGAGSIFFTSLRIFFPFENRFCS